MSSRNIAPWGYERIGIGGLSLLTTASNGDWVLASYHPETSDTWHWSICLAKNKWPERPLIDRSERRHGQWHDSFRLPFGYMLIISRQDYHRAPAA